MLQRRLRSILLLVVLLAGLATPAAAEGDSTGAEALAKGLAAREAGDHEAAKAAFAEAKAAFQGARDRRAGIAHFYEQASNAAIEGQKQIEAAMLINAGQAYMGAGALDVGVVKVREALAFAEKHGARNWQARGGAMLAQMLQQMGRYEEAIAEAEKAAPILEELGDAVAGSLAATTLGRARASTGALGLAVEDMKRGLAIAEEAKFQAGILHAKSHLGIIYHQLGDYEAARLTWESELEMSEQAKVAPRRIDNCYTNLCQVHWDLGEYDGMEAILARGLKRADEHDRELLRAYMRMFQGQLATLEGDGRLGLKRFLAAEKIFRRHGEERRITDAYLNVGSAYARMGRVERGIKFLAKRLAQIQGAAASTAHKHAVRDQARLLLDLSRLHAQLGQFDMALDRIAQGRRLGERAGDKHHLVRVTSMEGTLYWKLGAYEHSLELHRRSLADAKALSDTRSEMRAQINVGVLLREMGDREGAMAATREVLALARERKDVKSELYALRNLAAYLQHGGDDDQARGMMAQAVELAEAYGEPTEVLDARIAAMPLLEGSDARIAELRSIAKEAHQRRAPTREIKAREKLARLYLGEGRAEEALQEAERAALKLEGVLGGLGDAHGGHARGRYIGVYHIGALAAAELDQPEDVFTMLEQSRAGLLVDALRARDFVDWDGLPEALVAEQAKARVAVSRAQERVAKAARRKDLRRRREAGAALKIALAEARDAADRLQREAKKQAELLFPRVPPLADVQALLAPDQAYVAFGFARDAALAVVVLPDAERVVRLGERVAIEKALATLVMDDPEHDATKTLASLEKMLVVPLQLGPAVKEVVVSPDGQLSQTPLSLLFGARRVALTPSATAFAHLMEAEVVESGAKVLALGDPFYGKGGSAAVASVYTRHRGGTASVDRAGGTLMALPATRPEVKAVGDVVLVGKQANEAAFRKTLGTEPRWRSVHFACHGLVNPDAAELCALALSPSEEDDGFLTSLEVLQMRIPTDLAVLSACETGRGEVKTGVGLRGLASSFIHAGAPRVVCSLWKVDDEATQAFMVKFYALWNPEDGKGVAPAEALRRAQAHVRSRKAWEHPYYWAAWVLWGLPR